MSDLIKRTDAIEAMGEEPLIWLDTAEEWAEHDAWVLHVSALKALPSAEAKPTVVRCKTMIPYGDFREWAKRIREDNPNVIVIPFDAEVASAEAVQGDAISKRFVSDAILQKISELNAQGEKAIPIAREFIRFKRFVDGLTPIRTDAVQGWIPCSERLPDVGEDVLAIDIDGDVDIEILTEVSRSDDIRWEDANGFYTDFEDIIAWMPLPKPYKGE